MAWVRPRAGCSCLVCGGPWPWVRWGENEAVRLCVCVRACVCHVCCAVFCDVVFRTVVS